jgi:hypothetical protein
MAAKPTLLAREKPIYDALAASWRAAYIDGTGDKATAFSNWSHITRTDANGKKTEGHWLVHFGPNPPVRFADDAREYTADELRDMFDLPAAGRRRAAPKKVTAPTVVHVLPTKAAAPVVDPDELDLGAWLASLTA